ncbi:MAG: imidazolonepropionase [Gammaproteobacteria bacterium]|nr:imidazolonepropionase [Gammaproteobacteria bacterium]
MFDLLIKNARIYPMVADLAPLEQHSIAVSRGEIAAIGVDEAEAEQVIDAENKVLLPGFIDCHTHALYAGDRMSEHTMKLNGASYEEIARAGGGIASTVADVRAATEDRLIKETLPRIAALAAEGVTSVEIKSGYGLSLDDELKMLRAIKQLAERTPVEITATFLGAHATPKEKSREDYVEEVAAEMLPAIAREKLAGTIDIFVENIGFTVADLQRIFTDAKKLGFKLRAHTDQLSNMGATAAAAEHGALSCDHLEYCTETDVQAMQKHGTVAVLLPGAFYFLRETQKPPVGLLRDHNVPIAIATDLNPGSSPVASLLTAMHMSAVFFGLTAEEILLGVTHNAAKAIGEADRIGSIAKGKQANLTVWDIPSPEFLVYQLGGVRPIHTFIKGIAL